MGSAVPTDNYGKAANLYLQVVIKRPFIFATASCLYLQGRLDSVVRYRV